MTSKEQTNKDKGVWLLFIVTFFLFFASIITFNTLSDSPENLIIGEWTESVWSYELLDAKLGQTESTNRQISKEIKNRLSVDLFIHKSENWVFEKPNTIKIYKKNGEVEKLKWQLVGRGHILKLFHENGQIEIYDIKEVNSEELTINFDMGMELRGVARLSFMRKKNKDASEV